VSGAGGPASLVNVLDSLLMKSRLKALTAER